MGSVRSYDPEPVEPMEGVKLSDFSFKLVQVELENAKKKEFTEKYKVKLAQNIRGRYSDDVVFGEEWRKLLKDFDRKLPGWNFSSLILMVCYSSYKPCHLFFKNTKI